MKRVLLTGASGFVGRHCFEALSACDYEVHAVSSVAGVATPGVHWHQANLLADAEVSELLAEVQPTHLLHCAWCAEPGKYWTDPENLRWVEAGLHLLQSFAAVGGRRVVAVGSCAEYDWRDGYCSEQTTPLKPATIYGKCKHAFQILLDAWSETTGISAAWGRLFFLYGPHEDQRRLVASVICSLLKDQPARCSHGQQIRDFLYVRDAAAALVALLDGEVAGPVNIASGVPVSLQQVIEEIANQLERPGLVKMGALPAPENEPAQLLADIARLRDEVGWSPKFALAAALRETIDWWRQESAK